MSEFQFDLFGSAAATPPPQPIKQPAPVKQQPQAIELGKPLICETTGEPYAYRSIQGDVKKVALKPSKRLVTPIDFQKSKPVFKACISGESQQAAEDYKAFQDQLKTLKVGQCFTNPTGNIDTYIGSSIQGKPLYQDIRGVRFLFAPRRYRKQYDTATLYKKRTAEFTLKGES